MPKPPPSQRPNCLDLAFAVADVRLAAHNIEKRLIEAHDRGSPPDCQDFQKLHDKTEALLSAARTPPTRQPVGHPALAIGDRVLLRDDPFAPSVVIVGYDSVCRVLRWLQPNTGIAGFGPIERYALAPQGWQDAPAPPLSAERLAELAHGILVPRAALDAARQVDASPERLAELRRFYEQRILWAYRHLSRVDTELEAAEIRGCTQAMLELDAIGQGGTGS